MIELGTATSTIDLDPRRSVIELNAPPLSNIINYLERVSLTNETGAYLTDNNGNRLVAYILVSTRSNVIELGA